MSQPSAESEEGLPDLSHIVSQLEELVQLVIDCEKKELVPNAPVFEVYKQLLQIRQMLDNLHASYDQALAEMGVSRQELRDKMQYENLKESEKRLFATLNRLQKQCEERKEHVYKLIQEDEGAAKEAKEALMDDAQKKQKRKGKFRSVGGKKGWLPT
jgi:hypothetical protein